MRCANCGSENLRVRETRKVTDSIYRERECKDCGYVFYTAEFECEYDEMYKKEWIKHNRNRAEMKRKRKEAKNK